MSYFPIAMASVPPQRPTSLARSMEDRKLNGEMTLQEALVCTGGMKPMCVDRPTIVHKAIGCVVVGDLPAKDEIVDIAKKRLQFLEVLIDWEGDLDLKELETLFFQQLYQDLPEPIKPKGAYIVPYTTQLELLEKGNRKWDIIKHIHFRPQFYYHGHGRGKTAGN